MRVGKFKFSKGSKPELLQLQFQRSNSGGSPIRSAAVEEASWNWKRLARITAEKLNIAMEIRDNFENENNISVAFRSADDCNTILQAMQEEWRGTALRALSEHVDRLRVDHVDNPEALMLEFEQLAREFHLDLEDIVALSHEQEAELRGARGRMTDQYFADLKAIRQELMEERDAEQEPHKAQDFEQSR